MSYHLFIVTGGTFQEMDKKTKTAGIAENILKG
jgi:hypothetical protein